MRPDHYLHELADVMLNSPIPLTLNRSGSMRINMSVLSDDSAEFDEIEESAVTDEGRLSRSLQTWMIDHTWSHIEPLEKPPAEPLYSGKLGKEILPQENNKLKVIKRGKANKVLRSKISKTSKLRRVPSDDSIHTNLSLLTCSSLETHIIEIDNSKLKRQKKRKNNSKAPSTMPNDVPFVSKWERLSNVRSGNINRLFINKQALANQFGFIGGVNNDDESEAFRMMDKDEQAGLLECGYKRGIRYINKSKLKRSDSLKVLDNTYTGKLGVLKRTLSLDSTKPWGAPIDIEELKRERMNRLIAAEQTKALQEKERQRKHRRVSRIASYKNASSSSSTRATSPTTTHAGTEVSTVYSVGSGHSSEKRALTPSEKQSVLDNIKEEKVTVWKADREILEIDLKKELTVKVKQKIESTRTALKRVTGYGDENEQAKVIGTNEEYPKHTEDDFCIKPRIIQRMRISPNLSGIIHDDIRVRMGRPRYHEIRESDMQQWDKGQVLNRAHRNLKVFNWLNSLKEVTFSTHVTSEIIDDVSDENLNLNDLLHVEAADEPDTAPLFCQYEVRIL